MHLPDALAIIRRVASPLPGIPAPKIHFVSPAMSAIIAAAAVSNEAIRGLGFGNSDCKAYAETTGFASALLGHYLTCQSGALQGKTYSPLVKLSSHSEVDSCNKIIADVLYEQLLVQSNERFVNAVVQVVGELHDNVPSHANGAGFSAAQVYKKNGKTRLEFAIADCGSGMLRNVSRVHHDIKDYESAIDWCLKRGNTTATPRGEWAQRVPEDMIASPFSAETETFTEENHHAGEGLWKLMELVNASGRLWIWSGDCCMLLDNSGKKLAKKTEVGWNGVAIEVELDIERAQSLSVDSQMMSALAERLGI